MSAGACKMCKFALNIAQKRYTTNHNNPLRKLLHADKPARRAASRQTAKCKKWSRDHSHAILEGELMSSIW